MVPVELAALVTERTAIPTIGIGAGAGCDGQVLVAADLIGLDDRYAFKFVRRYAEIGTVMAEAFAAFASDVRRGEFPGPEHAYAMTPEVAAGLRAAVADEDDAP